MRTKRFRELISSDSYIDCVEIYVDNPLQYIEVDELYMDLIKILQSHISNRRVPVLGCSTIDIDERMIEHHIQLAQMLNIPIYVHVRKKFSENSKYLEKSVFSSKNLSVPYKIVKDDTYY